MQHISKVTPNSLKPNRQIRQIGANPNAILNRLAERALPKVESPAPCRHGREPVLRRGGPCSVCTVRQEFEFDLEISQLINDGLFKRAKACPFRVISSHLVAGLSFGPEALRARSSGRERVDPVAEVKIALQHIRKVLGVCGLSRDELRGLRNCEGRWKALSELASGERALEASLESFGLSGASKDIHRTPRGRTGALHIQGVANALVRAWRHLTGRFPAKDNVRFHDLLSAAVVTIFGHAPREPNWESATRTAVKHMEADAARRT